MEGKSKNSAAASPDIVFAQKATAIVKAAGMDPKSIDLEKFRKLAPIIFSQAYCAIYKETLVCELTEFSSKTDQILNSQLVIDGLVAKTKNPILLQISGTDIFQGSHRAIGIIVGILFAEGQRLWLEKVKQQKLQKEKKKKESEQPINPEENSLDPLNAGDKDIDAYMSTHSRHSKTDNNENDIENSDDETEHDNNELIQKQAKLKKLSSYNSNISGNVSPRELSHLLNRITYLEEKLKKTAKKPKIIRPHSANATSRNTHTHSNSNANNLTTNSNSNPNRSTGKSNKKKKGLRSPLLNRTSSGELEYSREIQDLGDDDSLSDNSDPDGGDFLSKRQSSPLKATRKASRIAKLIEASQKALSSGANGTQGEKKSRPQSAPMTRKVRQVSSRLYSAKLNKDALDAVNNPQSAPALQPSTPPKSKKPSSAWDGDQNPGDKYTYDMRSGRRILVSQAEFEIMERKRTRAAMGNVMQAAEMDDDMLMGNANGIMDTGRRSEAQSKHSEGPVKSEWPGKSTSKSVNEWLKKMKQARDLENGETISTDIPQPKFFNAYKKLEHYDIMISIEHCVNCDHHNVSTRHKCAEYVQNADKFLMICAQLFYNINCCVRIGVTRFSADVTPKSKTTDVGSRIGAFEIQIAYKGANGEVHIDVLHSKLASRHWPSKSVLDKRIKAFASKVNMPNYVPNSANESTEDMSESVAAVEFNNTYCSEPYPIGNCTWLETPLSNPSWFFAVKQHTTNNTVPAADGAHGDATADGTGSHIPNIQWVYDTRPLNTTGKKIYVPKYKVGSIVRVADLCYDINNNTTTSALNSNNNSNISSNSSRERHMLLGVVKDNHIQENTNDITNVNKKITVKLKYHHDEVVVSVAQCMAPSHYKPREVQYNNDEIPTELEALFLLAQQENIALTFEKLDNNDKNTTSDDKILTFLTRNSTFTQLRALCWRVEQKLKQRNILNFHHPVTNTRIDAQFVYGEEILDWLFNRPNIVDNLVNISELVDATLTKYPTAIAATTATTTVTDKNNSNNNNNTNSNGNNNSNTITADDIAMNMPLISASSSINVDASIVPDNTVNNTEINTAINTADQSQLPSQAQSPRTPAANNNNNTNNNSTGNENNNVNNNNSNTTENTSTNNNNNDTAAEGKQPPSLIQPEQAKAQQSPRLTDAIVDQSPAAATNKSPRPVETPVNNSNNNNINNGALDSVRSDITQNTEMPTNTQQPNTIAATTTVENNTTGNGNSANGTTVVQDTPPVNNVSPRTPLNTTNATTENSNNNSNLQIAQPTQQANKTTIDTARESITSSNSSKYNFEPNVSGKNNTIDPNTPQAPQLSDAEKLEIDLKNEALERQNLDFQAKDLVFSSIIIEGESLEHATYDTIMANLTIDDKHYVASVCLARERGSKRRSFNLSWGDIFVSSHIFKEKNAYLSIVISDLLLAESNPKLPVLSTTELGVSKHSIRVPMYKFMKNTFEIRSKAYIEPAVEGKKGDLTVVVHGHAHEAKEARNTRIMSMRPQDLLKLKFEPLPIDHDDDLSEEDEDHEVDEFFVSPMNNKAGGANNQHGNNATEEQKQSAELSQTLFPKASLHNLMSPSHHT